MILQIITLISYQNSYKVEENKRTFDVPIKCGFECGQKFTVKIQNCNIDELLFIITTQDKMEKFMNEHNMHHPCNVNFSYAYHIKISNEFGGISGIIPEKGIYRSYINTFDRSFFP